MPIPPPKQPYQKKPRQKEYREMTWKRLGIYTFVLLFFLSLPLILITNPAMDALQERVDRNPQTGFNQWLQLAMADLSRITLRVDRAAEGYERYLERYDDPDRRAEILMAYGKCLEETDVKDYEEKRLKYEKAMEVYEAFLQEFPDNERAAEAQRAVYRVREKLK